MRSVENVVSDLMTWYVIGINRRHNISQGLIYLRYMILIVFIPFAIIALGIYDLLVSYYII